MSDWWAADPIAEQTPRVPGLDQRARDMAIRTIYGEAAQEPDEGMAGVAAVIRNRVEAGRYGGKDVPSVVLAKNQFEPWNTDGGRLRMSSLKPDSPAYQRIGSIVDRVFSGDMPDPTNGATHFFAPQAQAALGRNVPSWAQGEGQPIGRHTFYAPDGRVQRTSAPGGEWWANDPIANQKLGAPPPIPVERGPDLPSPQQVQAQDIPGDMGGYSPAQVPQPPQSASAKLVTDFENMGMGPGQGTSPHPDQYGKPISTELHQSDSGEILFKDPNTGQLVPTNQAQHVVLKDPEDGRLKVYARSAATDEGALTGAGRLFARGFLAGAPTSRAAIGAARTLAPGEEVVAAASRLSETGAPVQVPRAAASDNMLTQQAGAVAANIPFAGTPLVKAAERTIDQLGTKADEVAAGFGGGQAVPSVRAADAAKSGITNWITGGSKAKANELYNKVDELVRPDVTVDLTKTTEAVSGILAQRSASKMLNPNPGMHGSGGEGKAVETVLRAIQSEGLTYQGLKGLRSRVGEMLEGGILPEGMSGKELKKIYGALTEDLGRVVRTAGGSQAQSAWERANRYYSLASERRESLAKLVGAKGDAAPEKVMDSLLAMAGSAARADIGKLAQARKAIGAEGWDEFVSGAVARLGRDVEGNFSPQRFLTAYEKLSTEGKSVLFRSTGKGDLADHLKDIAAVSSRFKELQKFANPSGTGRTVMGGAAGTGLYIDPMTTVTSLVGGRAMAMALARPATAAGVSRWMRATEALVSSPSAPRLAAYQMASKNLAQNLQQIGVSIRPEEFLKALQSGSVARPDEGEQ